MKTVVIFYSFSGKTKEEARKLAREYGADVIEVKEKKKRSVIGSYFKGCPQAMKRACPEIEPLYEDLSKYDKIVLCAPVWAGYPAPAFNSICELLPSGKEVDILLTSGSGNSKKSKDSTAALIKSKGCKLVKYTDVVPAK